MDSRFLEYQNLLRINPPRYMVGSYLPVLSSEPWWSEFVVSCNEHAAKHCSGTLGERNLIAVHPYCPELENRSLSDDKRQKITTLENLLRSADRKMFSRVLFDSYRDYGLKSHQLVDEGVIDQVVFTYDDAGIPLVGWRIPGLSSSSLNYILGSYGYGCVPLAMLVVKFNSLNSRIIPVRDAIIYKSPFGSIISPLEFLFTFFRGIDTAELLRPSQATSS